MIGDTGERLNRQRGKDTPLILIIKDMLSLITRREYLPESFEVPVETCSGVVTGKGTTYADANTMVLAKIDRHDLDHLNKSEPPCEKTWLPINTSSGPK